MDEEQDDPVVAVMPGQGWRIEWLNNKGRTQGNDQLVGWACPCVGAVRSDVDRHPRNLLPLAEADDDYRLVQPLEPFHL